MSAWKWLGKLCSLTPQTKRWSLQLYYGWKTMQYRERYEKKEETDPCCVVFESFMGKKYACSPKALYEAMAKDPAYKDWKLIWAFRNPEKYRFLEQRPNTSVVTYRKGAYYQALAKAGFWITNSRMPREVQPKRDQAYIQCWHGTPLKRLGYDLEHYAEEKSSLREVRENYLAEARRITHMPSPSPFYTEKIRSAFHLEAEGKADVLQEWGYPRNDRLFTAEAEEIRELRRQYGIPEDRKVILYAPTWRENQHVAGGAYTYQLQVNFDLWKDQLGEEYVILFRAHYFISNGFDFSKWKGFVKNVSDVDDINDLYLMADLLITDYSSVFFDYANLCRPIFFYMYDYEQYKNQMRDFYFSVDSLPGPVLKTQEELLKCLKDIDGIVDKYQETYRMFNEKFNPHRHPCCQKYLDTWLPSHPEH